MSCSQEWEGDSANQSPKRKRAGVFANVTYSRKNPRTCAWGSVGFALFVILVVVGCAGPGPRTFPPAPMQIVNQADSTEFLYDLDADERADFSEIHREGRVTQIAFPQQPGTAKIRLSDAQTAQSPQVLIILDSIPFELVQEAWNAGRFRYFHPPSRIISPFPVMTDPALAEFFGVSPCVGVESVHYDGTKLVEGYSAYLQAENAPWLAHVDYHLDIDNHAFAYLWPGMWFRRELRDIQEAFARFPPKVDAGILSPRKEFVAYCVGTSCLGSKRGRDGHHYALVELDRYCRQLIYDRKGNVQITLMSDHGHNLVENRRLDLSHELERLGYRVGKALTGAQDVVIPEFGLVSCAAIHTRSAAQVARDCIGLAGVELACYVEGGGNEQPGTGAPSPAAGTQSPTTCVVGSVGTAGSNCIVVLSRDGEARIARDGDLLKYTPTRGDPLHINGLTAKDARSAADALFRATLDHEYPDPLDRLWRAFHGLFKHAPDVLLSLEDGAFAGSEELTQWLEMRAVHGNLNRAGSSGFMMTTRHTLPPAMRMRDARRMLDACEK